jgi:hypothetical protein
MPKTVGIQEKPEVDLDELDRMKEEAEEKEEETPEEEQPEEPEKKEEEKEAIDYETKFKASQREALILKAKLDRIEEEKHQKVEITDDFLKGKYTDWEDMTTGEQRAIKKTEELEQEITEIKNRTNEFNNDKKWEEKVDTYINEELPDLVPELVGHEEEFRKFASGKTHKGESLELLAKSFAHDNPILEKKRSLFHAPGGNRQPEKKSGTMSADEARNKRISAPSEYLRLIRAKKIRIEI